VVCARDCSRWQFARALCALLRVTLHCVVASEMSDIEETLERIKGNAGVEGYVIVSNTGEVLRKLATLSTEKAKEYGDEIMKLAKMARHVVRDLDPKVRCVKRRPGGCRLGCALRSCCRRDGLLSSLCASFRDVG
jgi:hypothetical protein